MRTSSTSQYMFGMLCHWCWSKPCRLDLSGMFLFHSGQCLPKLHSWIGFWVCLKATLAMYLIGCCWQFYFSVCVLVMQLRYVYDCLILPSECCVCVWGSFSLLSEIACVRVWLCSLICMGIYVVCVCVCLASCFSVCGWSGVRGLSHLQLLPVSA